MLIENIKFSCGVLCKFYNLNSSNVLIYSKKNSVGKSTLLRGILYGLGFKIPDTKNLKFSKFTIELNVITDSKKKFSIVRQDNIISIIDKDTLEVKSYSLPNELLDAHQVLFEIDNVDILQNILGVMYVDQEKGWTLLNRGIVIGSIRFQIESFIQGLSGVDCTDLYNTLKVKEEQIKKYQSILEIYDYQKNLQNKTPDYFYESKKDLIENDIISLEFEKRPLIEELNRLKKVLNKNKTFKDYIADMKLFVIDSTGVKIPVNESTLDGFSDNYNLVSSKISNIKNKLQKIEYEIWKLKNCEDGQQKIITTESTIESLDNDIAKLQINDTAINNIISKLRIEKSQINEEIVKKTKSNNLIIGELHNIISSYAKELGLQENYVSPNVDYIFTSDLKSLSGATYHKLVFCFQLAYIKMLRQYKNILVPIILDSPRGKEVDDLNIEEMIALLKRDFSQHQILISSIYKYDLPDLKVITIENKLLENSGIE